MPGLRSKKKSESTGKKTSQATSRLTKQRVRTNNNISENASNPMTKTSPCDHTVTSFSSDRNHIDSGFQWGAKGRPLGRRAWKEIACRHVFGNLVVRPPLDLGSVKVE